MSSIHLGPKISEQEFVDEVRQFLCANGYIREDECHFDGDSDACADVELALEAPPWPAGMPAHLLLEAKCHHSEDAPNAIIRRLASCLKKPTRARLSAPSASIA